MSDIEESIYDERKRSHDDDELNFTNREYSSNDAARYSKRPALKKQWRARRTTP